MFRGIVSFLKERHKPVEPTKVPDRVYLEELKNTEKSFKMWAIGISFFTAAGLIISNYGQQIQLFARTLGLGK